MLPVGMGRDGQKRTTSRRRWQAVGASGDLSRYKHWINFPQQLEWNDLDALIATGAVTNLTRIFDDEVVIIAQVADRVCEHKCLDSAFIHGSRRKCADVLPAPIFEGGSCDPD